MKPRFTFLTLALALCGSVAASAQQAPQPDDPPPQGRYPLGSSLSVTPAMVVVVGHDTNAIRTNTGTPAGEVYVVPQIEGWVGRGRLRLNFADAIEISRQQVDESTSADVTGSVAKGQVNQYHELRLAAVGARASLEGRASYRDHYAPPTDFSGFEYGIKSRRVETNFGLDAAVTPGGRFTYRGRVSRAQLRYDADAVYEGTSLQKNLNRNLTLFGGDVLMAITPMTSASVSASAFRDRFLFAPERDGDGLNLLAGVQFSPRALISGRAEVGYLGYTVVQSGIHYGSPAYNLGLSFARSPVFIDVSGRRSIEYSFDPGQGFFISNGIEVFSIVTLGKAWEAFGRLSIRGLSPQGDLALNEPYRTIESYKAGIARKFSISTKIGADIERYVTGGGGGFEGVRATIFFTYGSTRLQRLDRPLPGGF